LCWLKGNRRSNNKSQNYEVVQIHHLVSNEWRRKEEEEIYQRQYECRALSYGRHIYISSFNRPLLSHFSSVLVLLER
jgi:hypothetical protein